MVDADMLDIAVCLPACPGDGKRNPEEKRLRFADIDVCEPPALDGQIRPQRPREVRQVCVNPSVLVNREPQFSPPNLLHRNLVGRLEGFRVLKFGVELDSLEVLPKVDADRFFNRRLPALNSLPHFPLPLHPPVEDVGA
jgi:hypothetical protein